jgi:hypothetical protein
LLYTVAPANAAVTVKVDGVVVNKTSGDFLDPLSNASHTVRVEATDGVNAGFAEVTFTVNYVPPSVTIRSPINSVYTDTSPLLRYSVNVPATVVVTLDGAVINTASGEKLSTLTDGEHIVRVEATDVLGETVRQDVSFIVYTGTQLPYEQKGTLNLGSNVVIGQKADSSGNIYVTSYICTYTDHSLWVTKYDQAGTVLWDSSLTSNSGDCLNPAGITVDSEGSAYVVLDTLGGIANFGNMGAQDTFLVKFDKDGNREWIQRPMYTSCSDWAHSVSVGMDGLIYVGGITGCGSPYGYHAFWKRYTAAGEEYRGAQIYLGTYTDADVSKIAADADGNVYLSGYTVGSILGDTVNYPNVGGKDFFVIQFDAYGSPWWVYQGGTSLDDTVKGMDLDDLGGVYITGTTAGSLYGIPSYGGTDAFVTKLDSSGTRRWTIQVGTASEDGGVDITVEKNGIVYVTGTTGGSIAGANGSGGLYVIKGDGSGGQFNQYWIKQFGASTTSSQDISMANPGWLFVREGNTAYKLRDPRLPSIAFDHTPMSAVSSSMTVTGTIEENAHVDQVSGDSWISVGLASYPTVTSWQITLSGMQDGINRVAVTAKKNNGFKDTAFGRIDGFIPPAIVTDSLIPGSVGTTYNQTLISSGGKAPIVWTISMGSLPPGLILNGSTGVISGSPTTQGTYRFTMQANDAKGANATKALSIVIEPTILPTTTPSAPTGLSASAVNADTDWVDLAWTDTSNNERDFIVERKINPAGTYAPIGSVPADVAVYRDDTVLGGTSYSYRVKAVNSAGDSPYSDEVAVIVPLPSGDRIVTIAGNGTVGYNGDSILATQANLSWPVDVAVDGGGNVYIADMDNQRIRKVSISGVITTVAGNGTAGYSGNGGLATQASLSSPWGVAVDNAGNIFIIDGDNNRIRKVNTSGVISNYAGNGLEGFSGDGGQATQAKLGFPTGVAVDNSGNLYIADSNNARVRKVSTSGIITTVAGNGQYGFNGDNIPATQAMLMYPSGVVVDLAGNLYIADIDNSRIRKINTSGVITTVAGNGTWEFNGDGIPANQAGLDASDVAVDAAGNILIADYSNDRVRKVDAAGIISTVAGNGQAAFSGDGGVAVRANLDGPASVATDAAGSFYLADINNSRIRKVYPRNPVIVTASLPAGNVGVAYSQSLVANGGRTPYVWSLVSGSLQSGLDLNPTTGVISGTPTTAGTADFTIQVTDADASFAAKQLSITVTAPLNVTTTALSSGTTGSAYNQALNAVGGTLPYSWSRTAGTMPTGLNLSTAGVISGTPTTAGTSTLTFQVQDAVGATNSKSLAISIYAPLNVTTASLANGYIGASYSQTLAASGGKTPYTWSISSGSLPTSLSLNPSTGVISGTPTTAETATFTVQASDADTRTATKTLSITISAAPTGVAQLDGWTNIYSASPNNTSASNLAAGSFAVGSGPQRLLLVSVVMEIGTAANPTVSATYGGTALTQIRITANTQREIVWMGYLKDAQIGSGSKALAISYSGATGRVSALHVKWASYTGVNQTNPVASSGSVNAGSTSVTFGSTINYVNNGMTVVVAGNGGTPATGTLTATPSFNAGTATTTNAQTSRTFTTAPHTAAGSYTSSTAVTWGGTTSAWSGLVVVSLQP